MANSREVKITIMGNDKVEALVAEHNKTRELLARITAQRDELRKELTETRSRVDLFCSRAPSCAELAERCER